MENLRSLEPQAKISHSYKKKSVFEMGKIIMVKVWSLTRIKVIEEDMIIQNDKFRI